MKRALTLWVLVAAALLTSVRPVHANLLDWMQEWSGPGPFWGTRVIPAVTWCPHPYDPTDESVQNKHPCWFFDYRHMTASDDDNFPVKVTAQFYNAGVTWRLRRSYEIGIGLGVMRASAKEEEATRFTVSAPRVVVKPVLLVPELLGYDAGSNRKLTRWLSTLKVYTSVDLIAGRLKAEDLGVSAKKSGYNRRNEWVPSIGILIDVGELLAREGPP